MPIFCKVAVSRLKLMFRCICSCVFKYRPILRRLVVIHDIFFNQGSLKDFLKSLRKKENNKIDLEEQHFIYMAAQVKKSYNIYKVIRITNGPFS